MTYTKRVLLICAVAFLIRMLLVSQAPNLAYEAYSTVRQVEHIQDTGLPLFDDPLSGAREHIVFPVFPYAIAFSGIFLPDNLAYLLIPNLLAVGLHAALFFLILELTNDERLALLGAAASILIPSYLGATLLTMSSLSLAAPLLIVMLTLFLKLRKTNEKRLALLIVFLLLAFTHALAILAIPLFIITLVLTTINRSRDEVAQKEFALFATFLLLWLYALIYKQILTSVGLETLRGNIPAVLRESIYANTTLGELAALIGVIPFGLALYAAYKEASGKHIGIQATIALAITIGLAISAHLIPLHTGLVLLSIVAMALAAVGLQHLQRYAKALKRSNLPRMAAVTLAVLFVATSALQTFTTGLEATQDAAQPDVVSAALWLEDNSTIDSMLITKPEWGYLFEHAANRPVYMDQDYLGMPNVEERYQNTQLVLSGYDAARRARLVQADYIVTDRNFDDPCLNTVYNNSVYIMKVLCR